MAVRWLTQLQSAPAASAKRMSAPTKALSRFNATTHWDSDSTPSALRTLSRATGKAWSQSGARTPKIEAAVVMASLMHDVRYYYGGDASARRNADKIFGQQIVAFAKTFGPDVGRAAQVTAKVDQAAVGLGGGFPFNQDYSWGFGFHQKARGYVKLEPSEQTEIGKVARETFKDTVKQIAAGTFEFSAAQKDKFNHPGDPSYGKALKSELQVLAKTLLAEMDAGKTKLPGL
jgi:hypothetical protein